MKDYYNRYLQGDKQQLWNELLLLTPVEIEQNSESITLILHYFVNSVKQNVNIIDSFLRDSNYIFTKTAEGGVGFTRRNLDEDPNFDFTAPDEKVVTSLNQEINSYGFFPKVFNEVYKSIGYINLEGYFPEWRDKNYLTPRPLIDPLVLMPLDMVHLLFELNDKSTLIENGQYYVGFSPTPYIKENTSDDGLLGVFLYEEEVLDGKLANYGRGLLFSDYLRNCFKWGGFPGLEFVNNIPENDPNMILIKRISKEMIPI